MEFLEYPKIDSIYKRDEKGRFLIGEYARPEFEYLAGLDWDWTEKIDGTNIRIHWTGESVRIGGKTDRAQIPAFLDARLQRLFPASKFDGEPEMILYGEGYGMKIQKGGAYIPEVTPENPDRVDFILFDVLVDRWWLMREDIEEVAHKLEIKTVPLYGCLTFLEAIREVTKGFDSILAARPGEGLVGKLPIDLFDRAGRRIITKIKTKDFR